MTPQAVASHSPAPPVRPVPAATRGRYVALGDAFAAGTGTGPCGRSDGAYPYRVAAEFDFAGTSRYAACDGAKLAGLAAAQGGRAAQLSRVDARTSLVTVQAGGDDLGFGAVLATCALQSPGSSACRAQEPRIRHQIARLRGSLGTVLKRVRHAAPRARVLVVGYPRLFADRPAEAVGGIAPRDQRWLNKMTEAADTALHDVTRPQDARIGRSDRGSVEFVDVADTFSGHGLGRADPDVRAPEVDDADHTVDPDGFQPTSRGQRKLAEAVIAQVRTGPDRKLR